MTTKWSQVVITQLSLKIYLQHTEDVVCWHTWFCVENVCFCYKYALFDFSFLPVSLVCQNFDPTPLSVMTRLQNML